MEKLFVSYEVALKMKKLGFDGVYTFMVYTNDDKQLVPSERGNTVIGYILAPLYQQVIDWLVVQKVLLSVIIHDTDNVIYQIVDNNSGTCYESDSESDENFGSYYEALNNGIERALELVEEKNGIYKNT